MGLLHGSYSLVAIINNTIVGLKDSYGIRPLCIGVLNDSSYILSSESCALDAVGAKYLREVEAGEIVTIDESGLHSYRFSENSTLSPCSFEQIYFSRPDSFLNGTNVYDARLKAGKFLYEQNPVEADVVIGVPQSGLPAAIGYSEASGIPYEMGIIKNQYSSRSFINPTEEMRAQAILAKINIVESIVSGKRVVVVDDSLVRGNTSKYLVESLRKHNAKEVHFFSASPPVRFPCYFGIDISHRKELMASKMPIEEMCKEIGLDSLTFLSLENLKKSFSFNSHCFGMLYWLLSHLRTHGRKA